MMRTDDYCSSAIEPESPIDLRVSKAHASHGYDTVRISIVSYTVTAPMLTRLKDPEEELIWDHSAPFQYRWTSQFDTGVKNARCVGSSEEGGESLKSYSYTWGGYSESPAPDSKCLFDCQGLDECNFFSFYHNHTTKESSCELFKSCTECESTESVGQLQSPSNLFQDKDNNTLVFNNSSFYDGWTTTKKYGKSFIHTALVKIEPGRDNPFQVDGTQFNVKIPIDGSTAKFVAWGDPCISSKFIGCSFGKYFDSYEKSVNMINALAEVDGDSGFDGFIMLGDNFYDSDGTITTSFWKRLTLKAMSKPLIYVLGNHDIWTGGAPASGEVYDPLQYSLQYFGIDTVVSKENGNYFDYTINPDSPPPGSGTKYQSIEATSSIKNSIGWYKFGGFGILFFNGAYSAEQMLPYFQEACDFFGESVNEEETLLLIGHWNGNETIQSWISPYGGQVVTPRARELLLDLPGCSHIGKRIIYFDGHGHTNVMVPGDNGYLAGGHGIMGMSPLNFSVPVAADYGFIFTKSSPTHVFYCQEVFSPTTSLPSDVNEFDPETINDENYNAILDCVSNSGIGKCVFDLCEQWTYFGDEEEERSVPENPGDVSDNNQATLCIDNRAIVMFACVLGLLLS